MSQDVVLFETNASTGETVETRLTGAEAEAWRAERRPSDERLWQDLRAERNRRLAETDYFANTDVTMPDAMRTYRQALRDLPANTSDPSNPTWPTKPAV
tara:strand:+ start:216 stop:512 length:297 start_codon:yes stop_codon:yes gene_type:complete